MLIRHLTLVPLAIASAMAVPAAAQVPDWTQLTPTAMPDARQNSALAYDLARGVTVLFGGWDGTSRRNDTWEWNGTVWTQINTTNAPSPRDAMTMAYDSVRQVTVCTAGYVSPDQTWEYDGTDWTEIYPAVTHALTPHCPMVFDINRGVCVLFGQSSATGNLETWEWDGTNWTQVITASAPWINGNMAYDSTRMLTVHLGMQGDTWEYDGTTWTQVFPATFPPTSGCGAENMVYDQGRQRVVLFGGCYSPDLGETWEYDGVDWQPNATVNVPSFPRRYPAMAYDSLRHRTVLFGGSDFSTGSAILVDDTWEYGIPGTLGFGYCFGDLGSGTPCPCGNDNDGSVAGAGCANGVFASGALLTGSGEASLSNDTLVLATTGLEPSNSGLYFQANNDLSPGLLWGDGLQCAGGQLKRLGVRFSDGSGYSDTSGYPLPISVKAGNVAVGDTKYYQCWYRNPAASPCGTDFNASNGYAVTWVL